ncbi:MAG: hypothetical protein Kapaf2KO_05980 [Candidatus Kapaibacteriales bacterium]
MICILFVPMERIYSQQNYVRTYVGKQINTYRFDIDANLLQRLGNGSLYLDQDYNGNGLIADGVSFRDEQRLDIGYLYDLGSSLKAGISHYNSYIADERALGVNDLFRAGGRLEVKYEKRKKPTDYRDYWDIRTSSFLGSEHNRQVGLEAMGFVAGAEIVSNFDSPELSSGFSSKTDYLSLSLDRQNLSTQNTASVSRIFGENTFTSFTAFYRLNDRSLLNRLSENLRMFNESVFSVEQRTEQRYGGIFDAGYRLGLTDFIFSSNIGYADIDRNYLRPVNELNSSKIDRELDEFTANLRTGIKTEFWGGEKNFNLFYESRREENSTENRFDLDLNEFESLNNQERLRDNRQTVFRMNTDLEFEIDNSSYLEASGFVSILRYDTPSEANNDDRDELTYESGLSYDTQISEYLSYNANLRLFAAHFVYIKSEFSQQNRWNRILSLKQSASYDTEIIEYKPTVELISNYTVFDFENLSGTTPSFSLRQITYSDSLKLNITKNSFINSRFLYRYYERGILFWSDFAETPESSNLERFTSIQFRYDFLNGFEYGLGIRYYALQQDRLSGIQSGSFSNFNQNSIGPEVLVNFRFSNGYRLELNGWYEFQETGTIISEVPNFFLTTVIAF